MLSRDFVGQEWVKFPISFDRGQTRPSFASVRLAGCPWRQGGRGHSSVVPGFRQRRDDCVDQEWRSSVASVFPGKLYRNSMKQSFSFKKLKICFTYNSLYLNNFFQGDMTLFTIRRDLEIAFAFFFLLDSSIVYFFERSEGSSRSKTPQRLIREYTYALLRLDVERLRRHKFE